MPGRNCVGNSVCGLLWFLVGSVSGELPSWAGNAGDDDRSTEWLAGGVGRRSAERVSRLSVGGSAGSGCGGWWCVVGEWGRLVVPGVPSGDPVALARVAVRLEDWAGLLERWQVASRPVGSQLVGSQRSVPVGLWWRAWGGQLDSAGEVATWARELAGQVRAYATVLTSTQAALASIRVVGEAAALVAVVGTAAAIVTFGASGLASAGAILAARAAALAAVREVLAWARGQVLAIVATMVRAMAIGALSRAGLSVARDALYKAAGRYRRPHQRQRLQLGRYRHPGAQRRPRHADRQCHRRRHRRPAHRGRPGPVDRAGPPRPAHPHRPDHHRPRPPPHH